MLDVGCGCDATTMGAARLSAAAVRVDVSAAMLAVGRQRARVAGVSNVEFVADDAAHPVMAFTNLRRALRVGGRLVFVCWQGLESNPWLLVPGVAAAAHVPLPPIGGSGGPGMFSLADRDHLISVVTGAGLAVEPVSPMITFGGGGTLDAHQTVRSRSSAASRCSAARA